MDRKKRIASSIENILEEIESIDKKDISEKLDKIKIILNSLDKKYQYLQSFFITSLLITNPKREKYNGFFKEIVQEMGELTSSYISREFEAKDERKKIFQVFSKYPCIACPFIEKATIENLVEKDEIKINVDKCVLEGKIEDVCSFSKEYFMNIFIRGFQNMLIEAKQIKEEEQCIFSIKIKEMELFEEL